MAKATISMCMSTTGFGVASSLGSQTLDSPVSYVSPGQLSHDSMSGHADGSGIEMQRPSSGNERRQIPKFDMNLKDLFSDVELQARSQSFFQQPDVSMRPTTSQQQQQQQQEPAPFTGQTYAIPATPETSAGTAPSPMQQYPPQQQQTRPDRQQPPQTYPYAPLSQTISQQQPADFGFDTLDFLDSFPGSSSATDPNLNGNSLGSASNGGNAFWPSGELDLGFGTGGLAGWDEGANNGGGMEGVGAGGGGPDLFDGFFFGGGGGFGG